MAVNEKLLRTAVAAIESSLQAHDPGVPHWDQSVWGWVPDAVETLDEAMCGTTACLAGWIVYVNDPGEFWSHLRLEGTEWTFDEEGIPSRALELLGMGPDADDDVPMFEASIGTFDELKAIITEATGVVFEAAP